MAARKPAAAAGAVPRCDKLLGEVMAAIFLVYGKPPRSRAVILEILATLASAAGAIVSGACAMPSRLWRVAKDSPAAEGGAERVPPRHLH